MADNATRQSNLRDQMPETAAFIDALRREFGAAMIDGQIRKGLRGEAPAFYAEEGGRAVGTSWHHALEVPALPSPSAPIRSAGAKA